MNRWRLFESRDEIVRVGLRDRSRVECTDTLLYLQRTGEGYLHRDLLVEQHADQEREGIVRQEFVGCGVVGQMQAHGHQSRADAQGGPETAVHVTPASVESVDHRLRCAINVVAEGGIMHRGEGDFIERGIHVQEPTVACFRVHMERRVAHTKPRVSALI